MKREPHLLGLAIAIGLASPAGCKRSEPRGLMAPPADADAGAGGVDAPSAAEDASLPVEGPDAGANTVATLEHAERLARAAAWAEHFCGGAFVREVYDTPSQWPFLDVYINALVAIARGRVGVDLGALERCEALAMDGVCDERDRLCFGAGWPFVGLAGAGEPCNFSVECTSGHCSADYACGVCLSESDLGGEGTPCASHAYCRESYCAEGRCWDGTEGDACSGGVECQRPLGCVGGRCRRPGFSGEGCAFDAHCAAGFYCDPSQGTCRALGTAGSECLYDSHCESGLLCLVSERRCIVPAAVGAPCGPTTRCVPDAFCGASTCELRRGTGQGCFDDRQCMSGLFCVEALCTHPSDEGTRPGDPCVRSSCDFADAGLVCVGAGLGATCEQAVIVGIGEHCDRGYPVLRYCRGREAECRDDGSGASRCMPLSSSGGACEARCGPLATCDEICRALPGDGDRCLDFEIYAYCGPGVLCGIDGLCHPAEQIFPACD